MFVGLFVGVDDGLAVGGEDGLGRAVVYVEGERGLHRKGITSLMDMFSWTMNSKKRVLSASLTLLYFFLERPQGRGSVELWGRRKGESMVGGKDIL